MDTPFIAFSFVAHIFGISLFFLFDLLNIDVSSIIRRRKKTEKFSGKFVGALAETLEIIKWNLKEGLFNLKNMYNALNDFCLTDKCCEEACSKAMKSIH
jgi:hypothetical protein